MIKLVGFTKDNSITMGGMIMKWLKYRLETTTEATDLIIDMLAELGIYGVEVIDKVPLTEAEKKQMYVDILPESEPNDGSAELVFYLSDGAPDESSSAFYNSGTGIEDMAAFYSDELIEKIREGLEEVANFVDVGSGAIYISETDEADWANKWKDYFHTFRIGDNIVVTPTWEEPSDVRDEDVVIKLDPGVAFGTGTHETTRLCVEALQKYVKRDDDILDVGCGSAILTIAALKLGAKWAYAMDIDPVAVKSAKENLEINDITEDMARLETGNLLEDEELCKELYKTQYDIVVANILAPVLVPLTPIITPALKEGGYYVCSGIVKELADDVIRAIQDAGLRLVSNTCDNDWVCLVARK